MAEERELEVSIDQDACTGDGLCVQYAPDVFEFDIDGLAYVKDADGEILNTEGAQAAVPPKRRLDIVNAAHDCPGECIYVRDRADRTPVAGPEAD
ncbi:ferredoxin [Glycomyces xiaoerkulensis]|uniref:ferredoxin n=1 Tax=Glycomyces xiaoerkulensis TaxID=2038139 RepID=UPI000C267809|nr:ferredoxin [Glycomyces xiaoerkulensis]